MDAADYAERLKTTGRNDPCPCGSGKKYKKCHLAEDEAARHEELKKAAEAREAALAAEAEAEAENEGDDKDDDAKEAKAETKRRDEHARGGKARHGQDSRANIPRRGAI